MCVDTDDTFWQRHSTVFAQKTREFYGLEVLINRYERRNDFLPFNALMRDAFETGSDYLVRVNDDTEFITVGWLPLAIGILKQFDPPNVGVVGPTCKQGNTGILTHDMVHRTHFQIFDTYYPTVFHNWYIDDWISTVYGSVRTKKLKNWEVVHHVELGTRYKPTMSDHPKLKEAVQNGVKSIRKFLTKRAREGIGSTNLKQVLSYSLYGSDPRYTTGAIENAKLYKSIYPGWTMRVYHDSSVPAQVLQTLRDSDVELRDMSNSRVNKMSWRFTVGVEKDSSHFCPRDIDARLSHREKLAVDAWIKSNPSRGNASLGACA